jgi:hypothetical protein
MDKAVRAFVDGEERGDSITLMQALSLGMGAALTSALMRLDMPDGSNPRESIDHYHGVIKIGAHDMLPRTPEWERYKDRYG